MEELFDLEKLQKMEREDLLKVGIEELGLSVRSMNRLTCLGVKTVAELVQLESLEYPGFVSCWGGHKAEKEILARMKELNLELKKSSN